MSDLEIQQRFDAASRLAKDSEDTAEVAGAVARQLLSDGGGVWCLVWQWQWGRLGMLASAGDLASGTDGVPDRVQEELEQVDQAVRTAMDKWQRKESAACRRHRNLSDQSVYTLAVEPPLGVDGTAPASERSPVDDSGQASGGAEPGQANTANGRPQRPVLAVQLAVAGPAEGDGAVSARHAESLLCGYGLLIEDHLRCQALRQTRADSRRAANLLHAEQQLRRFRHAISGSLDWERTAMSIVNASVSTTRCQRASVMVSGPTARPLRWGSGSSAPNSRRGNPRSRVLAVSGVATMDHQSPLVRRLSHLGDVVAVLDQPIASVEGRLFRVQTLLDASDAHGWPFRRNSTASSDPRPSPGPGRVTTEPGLDEDAAYPASEDWPPILEQAVESYVDQSHVAHLIALPLRVPWEKAAGQSTPSSDSAPSLLDGSLDQTPMRPIGVLVFEFQDSGELLQAARQAIAMSREAAVVLRHAVDHSTLPLRSWSGTWRSWFGRPYWRAVVSPGGAEADTRLQRWLGPGLGHPLRLTLAASLLLFLAILWWVPGELTVTADGTLQPAEVRPCFAPRDGTVTEVFVRHSEVVGAGEPLLRMHSPELELEMKRTEGAIDSTQKELRAAEAARRREVDDRSSAPRPSRPRGGSGTSEGSTLAAEEARLHAVLESYRQQLELLQEERERLTIRSPTGGTVLTWQLRQSLLGRPVRRGQRLLRISEADSPWTLRLNLPDRHVGHVLEARESLRSDLAVHYVVAGEPGLDRWGRLDDWSPITTMTPEGEPVVELSVEVSEVNTSSESWRAGTQVRARIHCGSHRLGYVWFHALWDAVRLHLLF